jgi:hypothetical protein
MIKDSSLGQHDCDLRLTMQGQKIVAETFLAFVIWFTVAAIYLALTLGFRWPCVAGAAMAGTEALTAGGGLAPEAVIEAYDLVKTFPGGVVALDRFPLTVHRGEVVVLIGHPGRANRRSCAVSNGIEELDAGLVVIDGVPLDHHRHNRL